MAKQRVSYPIRGNFINGQFRFPNDASSELTMKSPADTTDELATVPVAYPFIDPAVQAARAAFPAWKAIPADRRASVLSRLKEQILLRQDSLADLMARELGRPLWDGKMEIQNALQLVEHWEAAARLVPPPADPAAPWVERTRPRGVLAVITSFHLPLVTPLSHLLPALLSGNTVIWKPAEKAPIIAQLLAECFESSDLPPGVFNLLQGDAEMGRRLGTHENIDGILFTGSHEVATRLRQDTLHHHWKTLVTETGGKNVSLLWDPTDFEAALYPIFVSAYLSAGQRPTTTARVIVQESLVDRFIERFHERAKAFSIGHPLENPFMGPLIDATAVDRYMKFMGIAAREGAELIMRGKTLDQAVPGHYVAPSICWIKNATPETARKSVYQQSELLGPNVAILSASSLEQAIPLANATAYGMTASVFTRDRATFEQCVNTLQFGRIHWNTPTTEWGVFGQSAGLKKSGIQIDPNSRSDMRCQQHIVSIERTEPEHRHGDYPGLQWK